MARSFDVSTESPASVEEVHAAFGSEDYWLARHSAGDATTTLDSLIVESDGTVTVHATQHLVRRLLPGLVAKLIPGDLKVVHSETWRPVGDRQVHGRVSVSASPGLGSGRAEAWLTPVSNGSQLRFAGKVEVKIPLWAANSRGPWPPIWLRTSMRFNASLPRGSPKMHDTEHAGPACRLQGSTVCINITL